MTRRPLAVSAVSLIASLITTVSALAGVALAEAAPSPVSTRPQLLAQHVVAPSPMAVRKPSPTPKPAVVHVKPKPTPVAHRVVAKTAKASTSPSPKPSPKQTSSPSLTKQQQMMRAVDRIPGYGNGEAIWVLKNTGSWGLAVMGGGTVYISPTVPSKRMYDVVAHEWSHLLTAKVYDNDVQGALDAMNAYFGGSDLTGAERAADCMARLLGATWTHYTPCTNSKWRAGARRLLSRQRL